MNWDAIGAIGQVLGSVAVFVTLGYLATQIRQARMQMARAASQSRWESMRELFLAQATNPKLADIAEKLTASYMEKGCPRATSAYPEYLVEQLGATFQEAYQWTAWQWAWWLNQEHNIRILLTTDMTPGERHQFDQSTRVMYAAKSTRSEWFDAHKPMLNPDAVRYLEELLGHPG